MTTPLAPALAAPASGSLQDPASGIGFSWLFRDPDVGDTQGAYALRRKAQGATAYEYWTGSGWSGTLTWNTASAQSVSIPFAHWYMTWPDVNRLSVNQSQAEAAVTGWAAVSNCGVSRDTGVFKQGVASLAMTSSGAGNFVASTPTGVSGFSCSPGEYVSARAWGRMAATSRTVSLRFIFYSAGGGVVSTVDAPASTVTSSAWLALEHLAVQVPATSAFYALQVVANGAAGAGEILRIDAASTVRGTQAPYAAQLWSWSIATRDAGGAVGPFANDAFVVVAEAPVVTVTGPTGSIAASRASASWGVVNSNGYAQAAYEAKLFTAAQYGIGGFDASTSPNSWESGEVEDGSAYSVLIDEALTTGTTYRAYVRVRNAGGQWSAWAFSGFTTSITAPAAPAVIVSTDPDTGTATIEIASPFNLLESQTADFEQSDSLDGWHSVLGAGKLSVSAAQSANGSHSMLLEVTGETYGALGVSYATYTNFTTAFATYNLATATPDV